MTELLLGIFLSLLALVGFLFNIYIVLALVLTKQVGETDFLTREGPVPFASKNSGILGVGGVLDIESDFEQRECLSWFEQLKSLVS